MCVMLLPGLSERPGLVLIQRKQVQNAFYGTLGARTDRPVVRHDIRRVLSSSTVKLLSCYRPLLSGRVYPALVVRSLITYYGQLFN